MHVHNFSKRLISVHSRGTSITFRSCWGVSVTMKTRRMRTSIAERKQKQINYCNSRRRFISASLMTKKWRYRHCLHHFSYIGIFRRFLRKIIEGPFDCKLKLDFQKSPSWDLWRGTTTSRDFVAQSAASRPKRLALLAKRSIYSKSN